MKKNYLFFVFFFLLIQHFSMAQCTPDPQYTQAGVYPQTLAPVCTNTAYSQVFTLVVPADTVITNPFPLTVPIDSVVLEALLGLPPGFSYVCSQPNCAFPGGASGCLIMTGTTPATPGNYIIRSVTNSYAVVFGSPFVQTDTSLVDTLIVLGGPAVTVNTMPAGCGLSNGSATCTASGPYSPYTYSWSTGATGSASVSGLSAGLYSVFVTNSIGCVEEQTFNISNASGATVSLTPTSVSCNGGNDGGLSAQVSGGTGPFTYSWSNGSTSSSISNLTAGSYTVTVTDALGCSTIQSGSVPQPAILAVNVTPVNSNCAGLNGSLAVAALGGTSPYSYSWSNGMSTQTISVAPGSYSVVVTDSKGCTVTQSGTVTAPALLSVNTSSTPSTGTNGTATATVTGGTLPYTYSWNSIPPQFVMTASSLPPGNYAVFVTDANGCTQTGSVTVQNAISIEDLSIGLSRFNVYPNPNQGIFTIEAVMTSAENLSVEIKDMKGSTLFSSFHSNTSELQLPVDISQFAKGIYVVSLITEKGKAHLKLMIQ
ncbi:MAG: T9SS type A sorting domain-containing protein [Bacteroidia bacterium]|nr:T9SS type A sorting domain-containing protein [Bacteroidia bacterium]